MKKIALLLTICFIFLTFPFTTAAEGTLGTAGDVGFSESSKLDYVEDELIVWTNVYVEPVICKDGSSVDFYGFSVTEIDALFTTENGGAEQWAELSDNRFPYCIKLSNQRGAVDAAKTLAQKSGIIEINYNYIVEAPEIDNVGSSSRDSANSGSGVDYTQWAHTYLQMSSVWGMGFTGSSDIKVAILDTGFEEHIDLQDNLDMSLAYDAYDNGTDISPYNSHGNSVAGIIGADYNDGGVNGICRNVTMIPIKIANDDTGYSNYDAQEEGVNKAIQFGADIISMSFGLKNIEESLIDVIENNGILFVTSAGNNGVDITDAPDPKNDTVGKRHNSPNWIVVGAMTQQEEKEADSNYSRIYVDLFAPTNVYSTKLNNEYDAEFGGTSAATPHVAAACALLMSKATHKTPTQIRQLLLENVKEIDGFEDYCVSGGTLSIVNAIEALYEEPRGAYTKGDISGDGYIDSEDYLLCRRICFGTLTPTQAEFDAADVNGSGTVDSADYLLLNRYCQKTYYFAPF